MTELVNSIKGLCDSFIQDARKAAEKGNKTAAKRARKTSLELNKLFKEFRKASIETEKNCK